MQHLQPNTTLQGGKYRIERVLGQGGFGITYLAVQTSLQRQVAIKEFFMKDFCSRDELTRTMSAPSTCSSKLVEQYRKKFIKEARNLARLNHPNIISVIDVFEENGTVYYVMPYLVGGSLQDYVKAHGALSESMAMKYVKQIAGALKYMHEEQHICHYDVKPANILLDDKGNAVLIDFGISKNYDAQGQETTTTPVGMSEGYAPIEQYQQNVEEFSPASDVYALGATLYYLLHGKRPVSAVHRASGTALLMSKHLSQGIKDIINASMKISKRERAKSVDVFMSNNNNTKSFIKWIVGVVITVIIFSVVYNFQSSLYVNENQQEMDNDSSRIVERMRYTTAIGVCEYSGPVDKYDKPDGYGRAYFENGSYYEGDFINGVMYDDDAYFKFANGDVFRGLITNDYFKYGTFTKAEDNSFFEGSFTNNKPDKGTWKSRN